MQEFFLLWFRLSVERKGLHQLLWNRVSLGIYALEFDYGFGSVAYDISVGLG